MVPCCVTSTDSYSKPLLSKTLALFVQACSVRDDGLLNCLFTHAQENNLVDKRAHSLHRYVARNVVEASREAGVRGELLYFPANCTSTNQCFFSDSDRLRRTGVTALIRETQGERTKIAVAESMSIFPRKTTKYDSYARTAKENVQKR